MAIQKIIIGCYRGDIWLVRMCVASIRYWYPDFPVELLKDNGSGTFDTSELESAWNIGVLETQSRVSYRSPVAKTEVFFLQNSARVLFIDSDVIFVGPVLDALQNNDCDFIVSPSRVISPLDEHVRSHYYDWGRLKEFDPDFAYPGYVFNSGQFVATGGILGRKEVEAFYDPPGTGRLRRPDIFTIYGDQGVLNYLLPKLAQERRARVGLIEFKLFAHHSVISPEVVSIDSQRHRTGPQALIHYAGEKFPLNRHCLRSDLLDFYEDYYYSKISLGHIKRLARAVHRYVKWFPGYYSRQLRSQIPTPVRRFLRSCLKRRPAAGVEPPTSAE